MTSIPTKKCGYSKQAKHALREYLPHKLDPLQMSSPSRHVTMNTAHRLSNWYVEHMKTQD
jgi:hypothetical protein